MREEASARKESSVRELVSTHERPRGEVRLRLLVREPAVPAAARLCVSVCLSPYTAVCERGGAYISSCTNEPRTAVSVSRGRGGKGTGDGDVRCPCHCGR